MKRAGGEAGGENASARESKAGRGKDGAVIRTHCMNLAILIFND